MACGYTKKKTSIVWAFMQDGRGHAGEKSVQRGTESHKKSHRKTEDNLIKNAWKFAL